MSKAEGSVWKEQITVASLESQGVAVIKYSQSLDRLI